MAMRRKMREAVAIRSGIGTVMAKRGAVLEYRAVLPDPQSKRFAEREPR